MITIRNEQLEAMRALTLPSAIEGRLTAMNFDRLRTLSGEQVRELVGLGIRIAERYRINQDEEILFFVSLMCEVSFTFFAHPSVAAVLDNLDLPTTERLYVLATQFSDADWNEIAEDTHVTADAEHQTYVPLELLLLAHRLAQSGNEPGGA